MGHYVNDYSKLWLYVSKLEKEKTTLSTTKSSLETKNAFLNKLVSKERKKRVRAKDQEELDHVLAKSCMNFLNLEAN